MLATNKFINIDNLKKVAKELDERHQALLEAEKLRAIAIEEELQNKIDEGIQDVTNDLNASMTDVYSVFTDFQGRLNNHEARLAHDESQFNIIQGGGVGSIEYTVNEAVKKEEDRAKAEELALQTAIDGKADKSHGTHVEFTAITPSANGTASVGTSSKVARADHIHPLQTNVSGNAGTATKLATARTITVGNTGKTFDGSGNVSWSLSEIGAAASSHTHNVLSVKSDNYKKNTDLPSTYERGETLFFINNPAEDGKFNGLTYGLVQTLKEYGSGPAAWQFLYPYNDGNQDKFYVRSAKYGTDSWRSWAQVYTSLNKPTPADIGAAAANHGTHVSYGGNGSATTVSRSDHTHTSVNGYTIWVGTQAEYDAITSKSATTLYFVKE